jgi:hypothetical protein
MLRAMLFLLRANPYSPGRGLQECPDRSCTRLAEPCRGLPFLLLAGGVQRPLCEFHQPVVGWRYISAKRFRGVRNEDG